MKRILTMLMMIFFAFAIFANERTEQQMKQAAMSVLNPNGIRGHGAPLQSSNLKQLKQMSKLSIYGYIDGGFAIVSNDDRFEAVIGYSETTYDDVLMPCGFKWWLETANEVMSTQVQRQNRMAASQIKKAKTSVAPFLSTKWGQGNPFNAMLHYTIGGNSYEFVTGCVATAMAQVMKHYEYPIKGTGSVSYIVQHFMARMEHSFEDSYYDWDNMLDEYNYQEWGSMRATTKAVATLMRDCGMAVEMNYGTESMGSGANSNKIAPAMKEHFSYDEQTSYYKREDYTKNVWMQMIYDELSAGRPIIYTGVDRRDSENPSGHAFVLHGYDAGGKVYVNWGWKGACDGYYDIDLLNPDDYQFSEDQDMIFAIPGEQQEPDNTKCKVKITASGSGKVIVTGDNLTYITNSTQTIHVEIGSSLSITIWPDYDYGVQSITVNGTDVTAQLSSRTSASQYTLTNITEDQIVIVTFEKISTKLTITSEGGGYVKYLDDVIRDATKEYDVNRNTITRIYYYPDEGYHLASIYENGIDRTWTANWGSYSTQPITRDTNVSIKFESSEKPKYTLTYIVDGELYKSLELEEGTSITPEPAPEKEGYSFSGWSEIPTTMPAHDVTVTGTFSINKYKLTYMVDGAVYKMYDVAYGTAITPEPIPIKEGYTFSGWSNIPATMPAHDVTVIGTFTINPFQRNVVVEEYTGTTCGWCPRGMVGMDMLREAYGNRFIGIAIHQYSGSTAADAMNINAYDQVSFSAAPSCRMDRGDELDPYYGYGSTPRGMLNDFKTEMEIPAPVGVSVVGEWNEDLTYVNATATIEAGVAGNYAIEYVLIADGLTGTTNAWAQQNYYVQYTPEQLPEDLQFLTSLGFPYYPIYNDVAIAVAKQDETTALGNMEVGEVKTNTYSLKMPTRSALMNAIDFGKVAVIAMVIDKNTNRIANAAKCYLEKKYDVGDLTSLLNFIMNRTGTTYDKIYDLNNDGELNIGDIMLIIKRIHESLASSRPVMARATDNQQEQIDLSMFTAMQFVLTVDDGTDVASIRLTGKNRADHQLSYEKIGQGQYSIVIYSKTNQLFTQEESELIEIGFADGKNRNYYTSNVLMATPEGDRMRFNSLPISVTTGISVSETSHSHDVFNLNGQRLNVHSESQMELRKGIYVINGKKVVVK